jgi:hypothetical protein
MTTTVTQSLHSAFDEAGLPLVVAQTPQSFSRGLVGNVDSFLMDIRHEKKRSKSDFADYFLLYPGSGNQVSVLATDSKAKQLIVQVEEQERQVRWMTRKYNFARHKWEEVYNTQKVEASIRRWLIGMDELHCFFAELPKTARCDTIKHAHEALKPKELRNKREGSGAYKRQGEWFLVPVSDDEQTILDDMVTKLTPIDYRWNVPLTGMMPPGKGRPHMCDEVMHWNGNEYARGRLQHPDHRTRTLNVWHRVYRNTEVQTANIRGQTWVD